MKISSSAFQKTDLNIALDYWTAILHFRRISYVGSSALGVIVPSYLLGGFFLIHCLEIKHIYINMLWCHQNKKQIRKLDICLWNTDAPGGNKVHYMAKSLSPKFWPCPTPRGMWCQWSVRNPWMNLQSKFGYCMTIQTLNIALCV